MLLRSLWLQNFRNHSELILELDENLTTIIGPNGSGKTNILEAIYLLATGKSFRAERTEEMITWQTDIGRIKAKVENRVRLQVATTEEQEREIGFADPVELEVTLTRGMLQEKRVASKIFGVNGVRRLQHQFAGQLKAVLFGPWDMRLIEGSPTRRREFLDNVLGQVFPEYRRALISYEKGLRRRNKVLQAIKEGMAHRSQLFFWDRLLIKEGNILTDCRRGLIEFLNGEENNTPTSAELRGPLNRGQFPLFHLDYDPSTISEQRLVQYAREEVAATATLVGPHRDDFMAKMKTSPDPLPVSSTGQALKGEGENGIDLSTYGSRGQQRMAILWLKLGELAFIEQQVREKPLLLLDDIFSELDHEHRVTVRQMIQNCQTIITAADEHLIEEMEGKKIRL